MPDLEFIRGAGADGRTARDAAFPPRIPCPNCSADLTFLPLAARFCNRCGTCVKEASASTSAPRSADAPIRQLPPRQIRPTRWFFNLWCACTDSDVEEPRVSSRSEVLLAYGKSMFNLGWRYEHALGARRNLSEAARCYWKAARLGDPEAAGRLAQEPLTPPDDPAPSRAS